MMLRYRRTFGGQKAKRLWIKIGLLEISKRGRVSTPSTRFTCALLEFHFCEPIEKMIPNKSTEERSSYLPLSAGKYVVIGHGQSEIWRVLKDFIQDRLKLPVDEFNRVAVAGMQTTDRLSQMLNEAAMAFLVMTAEDQQPDGKLRARENVVHEIGLFQGRCGFNRAIVLLEEGCEEFSNLKGLTHIPFPKGKIGAAFEEIRRVIERERLAR
jgi:predicted nucleotide-binding protein